MRTIGIPLRRVDDGLASARFRITIPSRHIGEQHYRYVYGTVASHITLIPKHSLTLAEVEALPGPLIWDLTDDHFDSDKLGAYYRAMPGLVDVVTCTTPVLAQRIASETGVTAVVIPDPIEYPRHTPRVTPPDKLFWYGHTSNLQALLDLRLERQVLIVTNAQESWCYPYSAENMQMGYAWCDAVIIPVSDPGTGPRRNAKSANRMTEAINAGRFVIANPMPAYEGWGMWVGDIREGLAWLNNNQAEALNALKLAQDKVTALLAPSVIARQWKDLFDSILDVEPSDGRATSMSILRTTGQERRQMSTLI